MKTFTFYYKTYDDLMDYITLEAKDKEEAIWTFLEHELGEQYIFSIEEDE